jgi:hypothetical protein
LFPSNRQTEVVKFVVSDPTRSNPKARRARLSLGYFTLGVIDPRVALLLKIPYFASRKLCNLRGRAAAR